ncbi:MAG TPA: hypothetical protein VJ729_16675 [Nitrososphaeraceae archaeon]|nr:hypothetical protein [Nitrososphaeraceae archaeon]
MVNTKRSKLLNSFYFESQVSGALHKCWKGYVIAEIKMNMTKWNSTRVEFRNANMT